ncbi:LEM3/CDC50 family protein [Helicosporidium sp. ATCC 50920]|nr:LEM3/CDC50 family protein [Helicosporidium sp. ATCC 50920]|eukprot:KDD75013.1 LEM3/CDC50 family protein [Helicosporidium sp. ATCC 50920]
MGIFFLAFGIPILVASLNIHPLTLRYDDAGPFQGLSAPEQQALLLAAGDAGVSYSLEAQVEYTMQPPVYVVYELGSFYQNYRRYVRSYDPTLMHDGLREGGPLPVSACLPFQYADGAADANAPFQGAINPCGQIAHSLFNDTFALSLSAAQGSSGQALALDQSDLAWPSDSDRLYGPVPAENFNDDPASRGGGTISTVLNQAQAWMVWQRPGGKPNVQKPYAQINEVLPAGSWIRLSVTARYDTYAWQGQKSVTVTTNSWMGGRNLFLGVVYVAAGGVAWLAGLALFLAHDLNLAKRRRYADLGELSWVKNAAKMDFQGRTSTERLRGESGVPISALAGSKN